MSRKHTLVAIAALLAAGACFFPIKPDADAQRCMDSCLAGCPPASRGDVGMADDDTRTTCERNCMERC